MKPLRKPEPTIGAVVLMAGRSSRMKEGNKLLMPLGDSGNSVAEQTLQSIVQAGYAPIVVVTGYEADAIRERLNRFDVQWIHNFQYEEGMGTSIARAFDTIEDLHWDGALIALGDMPFVSVETLSLLRTHFVQNPHQIIAPRRNERRGQPVIFPVHFFGDLRRCSGDVGGKWIVNANFERLSVVTVDDEGIHWDVDTTQLLNRYVVQLQQATND